jgi:CheY-like chemotaxis protein
MLAQGMAPICLRRYIHRVNRRYKRVNPYFCKLARVISEVLAMIPIDLPVHVEVVPLSEVPEAEETFEDSPGPAERRPVVLIVDDERLIADTLSAIFAKCGFVTWAAYDARSALEVAKLCAPEILISDVALPGMNGVELAIALVEAVPACKVLLFSAHAGAAELVLDAREKGHEFLFLAKPLHPAVVVTRVKQMVAA